jgi:RNA polymerase sigma-54 factor
MLLQPKLNLRVGQRQVLTPGLVQMVSVLALNKLELKEMINAEIVENPVLEEVDESVAPLEETAQRENAMERSAEENVAAQERTEKTDSFDEVDFGSYFQDYLDPGFRTGASFEDFDKPSFENFLSQPGTLSGHMLWQIGSLTLAPEVRAAAEIIVGNLNDDGYLNCTDDELVELLRQDEGVRALPVEQAQHVVCEALAVVQNLDPAGVAARDLRECLLIQIRTQRQEALIVMERLHSAKQRAKQAAQAEAQDAAAAEFAEHGESVLSSISPASAVAESDDATPTAETAARRPEFQMDTFATAEEIVLNHLPLLQRKDMRELGKACGRTPDQAQAAVAYIRTLDPRPGQRYNHSEARLIEPDVAFVKRGDDYAVVMNEDDLPTLHLNHGYRRMLRQKGTEKEVREYVKERYRSAIQLLRNIEQRKNTIVRTCEAIVRRQREFLERGVDALKPMMIKDVAEEIGVHPSTVSRAVANKYVHTSQGVYELRFFFSEGGSGQEGEGTPLVLLKRKVKKLIEEEDPRRPLTDDHIAAALAQQGIQVTRRTVAKYREDLQIASTHQRRVRV